MVEAVSDDVFLDDTLTCLDMRQDPGSARRGLQHRVHGNARGRGNESSIAWKK